MYNILGQLKSEEKKLDSAIFFEIENMYDPFYIREEAKYVRLLVDLGKFALLPIKEVRDKRNIKSNKILYRVGVTRELESVYLRHAYNRHLLPTHIISELNNMGIIIGNETKEAIEAMILHKFFNIPERLYKYKLKPKRRKKYYGEK